jgi:hypothetical protein
MHAVRAESVRIGIGSDTPTLIGGLERLTRALDDLASKA